MKTMKITIKVPDMTCNHCKMAIEGALRQLGNLEEVEIDLDQKIVEVVGDVEVPDVVDAIQGAGYTAEEILGIQ